MLIIINAHQNLNSTLPILWKKINGGRGITILCGMQILDSRIPNYITLAWSRTIIKQHNGKGFLELLLLLLLLSSHRHSSIKNNVRITLVLKECNQKMSNTRYKNLSNKILIIQTDWMRWCLWIFAAKMMEHAEWTNQKF